MANEDTLNQLDNAQGNWATINTGQQTVATAGTAEQLNGGTSLTVPDGSELIVRALPGNSDTVYVGDSSVSASSGHALDASDPVALSITDVSSVYVDAGTSGEGVSWAVVTE
jgi:hypothetical protein